LAKIREIAKVSFFKVRNIYEIIPGSNSNYAYLHMLFKNNLLCIDTLSELCLTNHLRDSI